MSNTMQVPPSSTKHKSPPANSLPNIMNILNILNISVSIDSLALSVTLRAGLNINSSTGPTMVIPHLLCYIEQPISIHCLQIELDQVISTSVRILLPLQLYPPHQYPYIMWCQRVWKYEPKDDNCELSDSTSSLSSEEPLNGPILPEDLPVYPDAEPMTCRTSGRFSASDRNGALSSRSRDHICCLFQRIWVLYTGTLLLTAKLTIS